VRFPTVFFGFASLLGDAMGVLVYFGVVPVFVVVLGEGVDADLDIFMALARQIAAALCLDLRDLQQAAVESATALVQQVFDLWVEVTHRRRGSTLLDSQRETRIRWALKRYPVQDVTDAVRVNTLAYVCDTDITVFCRKPGAVDLRHAADREHLFRRRRQRRRSVPSAHLLRPIIVAIPNVEFLLIHFSMRYKVDDIGAFFEAEGLPNLSMAQLTSWATNADADGSAQGST